jgi:hypothetical protein
LDLPKILLPSGFRTKCFISFHFFFIRPTCPVHLAHIEEAFGNDSVTRAQIFRWHKDFVNGREAVEDEPRSGRPASVRRSTNVDRVRAFIRQDQCLTIRMIADDLNVN